MLRIERLSADAQETLRVLAAGRRLDHEILSAASGIDSRALRDALREAVAAQLVVTDEEARYMFRHALLREVVIDDLLPGERADMHLALARALEHRAEGLPAHGGAHLAAGIAHHYLRPATSRRRSSRPSAPPRPPRPCTPTARPPRSTRARCSYGTGSPAPRSSTGRDHISLLRAAAHTIGKEHEPARAESYLRAALHELGDSDPVRTADLLEHLARNQFNQGRPADAAETRRQALDLLPEEPSKVRATLLASVVKELMLESRHDEAVEAAQEALAVARAVGDESPSCARWTAWAWRCSGSRRYEEGEKALRDALSRMPERGLIHYLYSHVNLADALFGAGRLAEARQVVEDGDKLAAEKGAPRRWLMMLRSELAFAAGDWAEAEAALPSAARPAMGTTFINDALRRIELALGRGDHDEARRLLDEARDVAADTREPQWIGPLGSLRAELERRAGDLDAARGAIDDALDRLDFCSQDVERMARVAATGVRVEADAAVRARDLGEDPSFAIGSARRADRPRRGVRGGRAARRVRVPGHGARRGGAGAGPRRPDAVDRRRRRVGGARAPLPRRAGAAAQVRGAARARRARRGGRQRRRGAERRAADRRRVAGVGDRGLRAARTVAAGAGRAFAGTRATRRGCRRRPVRAHAARAPGPGPARRRADQPGDRPVALYGGEDRERPRLAHPLQAGRALTDRGRGAGPQGGPGLDVQALDRSQRLRRAARPHEDREQRGGDEWFSHAEHCAGCGGRLHSGPRSRIPGTSSTTRIGNRLPPMASTHYCPTDRVHYTWDTGYEPLLTVADGDTVVFETRDVSDNQIGPGSDASVIANLDWTRVYPLAGPVYVEGAEPGDTLAIEILDLHTRGWGWTAILPGLRPALGRTSPRPTCASSTSAAATSPRFARTSSSR